MPFRRRFARRPIRRRRPGAFRGPVGNFFKKAVGAVKSTATEVGKAAVPILMSEAKRFLLDILVTGHTLHSTAGPVPYRAVITTIPRNLAETNLFEDNRTSRKIHCKGLSMRYTLANSAGTTNNFTVRMIVAVQDDSSLDLTSGFNLYAPIGSTRGVKIIRDQYLTVHGDPGAATQFTLKRYVKLNHKAHYKGNAVDGSDTEKGSVVVYFFSTGPNVDTLKLYGGSTLHYHETM